jgi:hypothetical protein
MKGTADTSLVKPAYSKTEFATEQQVLDFEQCCDPVDGPLYYMSNFMMIQHPTKGAMQFTPFDYQEELIKNYVENRFSINMLARQLGKTTVAGGYLLWYAMFIPDSTILVASKTGRDAQEIMQRVRYAYENTPDHIRAGVVEYNKGSISFDNGSRIVAQTTTENTGRGMSISLVYLDEFAFVRNTIAKEFWTSLSPTLSTGGKCIITSTPNSDDDTFAQIWRDANNTFDEFGNETKLGRNGFAAYMATWEVHPDRDEKWAKEERGRIGEERFRREMNCEFIIFEETLINSLKLVTLEGRDPTDLRGQVRWYKRPNPSCIYTITLDPSAGTGGDHAAIQVIELPTMRQAAEWQHNQTPVEGQIRVIMSIMQYLRECGVPQVYWTVENNAIGEAALAVIRDTGEENFPGDFMSEPRKAGGPQRRKGFNTSQRNKTEACIKLKSYIEYDRIEICSKPLIKELKNFVAHGNSYAAKPGEHDDLVMSLVLAVRLIELVAHFEDEVSEAVHSGLGINFGDEDDWDAPFPTMF